MVNKMDCRAIENQYRHTVVCVDSYHDSVMKGRIYNPYINGSIEFRGIMSFLLSMEKLLEKMKYPLAYEEKRYFGSENSYTYRIGQEQKRTKGKEGTFVLNILFRQNASWQGTIRWEDGGKEERFRSALELLLLMNSALQETDLEKE